MATVYAIVADQHKHKDGPWPLMTQKVVGLIGNRTDTRVLDIATGPGQPGITIAQTLPNSKVYCTDISADMIAKCKATVQDKGLGNVTASTASAEDLSQFPDNTFDVVTCCYGYMFSEDKVLALSETLRVLKPGGSLIATTWDEASILEICKEVMRKVLGAESPAPVLNPLSLAGEGLFKSLILEAGFKSELIERSTSTYPFDLSADKELQYKIGTLIIKPKLDELDAHEVARETFFSIIGKYGDVSGGGLILPRNTFAMTIARKDA